MGRPDGSGAPGRTRTADAGLRTASLCPLSYGGAGLIIPPLVRNRRRGSRVPSTTMPAMTALPSPTSFSTAARAATCATRRAISWPHSSARRAAERPHVAAPSRNATSRPTPPGSGLLRDDPGRRARRPAARARDEPRRSCAPSSPTPWTASTPRRRLAGGTDLTFPVAVAAGLISFLSPCVLPLVPAYLGQLTAVAVAASATGARPSRWLAVRHALAYVAGFGAVFTLLGITATFAGGPLADYLPAASRHRRHHPHRPRAQPRRHPPHPRPGADVAAARCRRCAVAGDGDRDRSRSAGQAAGHSWATGSAATSSSARGGWLASFGLGAIFAIGWTPCIGVILGGILTLAATSATAAQGALLLVGYTLGLGLPFIAHRAPSTTGRRGSSRPLVRHGRDRVADRRAAGRRASASRCSSIWLDAAARATSTSRVSI